MVRQVNRPIRLDVENSNEKLKSKIFIPATLTNEIVKSDE